MDDDRENSGVKTAKPVLKWAGGKTQLLGELLKHVPANYGKYIEPFFGGGALFFALEPREALIADINPELINLYCQIRDDVDGVISRLKTHQNDREYYYHIRSMDWEAMEPAEAAARTIYLNRTCYNGLYRVNKAGQFNVPFAAYSNPKILDVENLRAVSSHLKSAKIELGDYKNVLQRGACPGDFVFLDPPYLPISKYSDFRRYTKERFGETEHFELAEEVERLQELGCHIVLTNSNHPLVHELYGRYNVEVVQTKRHISSRGDKRVGEDVVVTIAPKRRLILPTAARKIDSQTQKYPATRYMGSKSKLLPDIWNIASQFEYSTVLDLFSGSGVVSYMFKAKGKKVIANDYMAFSANIAKALVENPGNILPLERANSLLDEHFVNDGFVTKTFDGLYFEHSDNELIDSMRVGISRIRNPYQRSIAMAALVRACLKKRPRGIFTYTGMRYNDGRKDLRLSFPEQYLAAVEALNRAVFDNGMKSVSRWGDALSVMPRKDALVYIDPPYYSPYSDNEYVRRYHFVEGLVRNWDGVTIQSETLTKKFKSYPTPFSSREGAHQAFDGLFRRHRKSVLLVSYSSNSLPTMDEMIDLMSRYKRRVEVVPVAHTYSFGNQSTRVGDNNNRVLEYLFVGY